MISTRRRMVKSTLLTVSAAALTSALGVPAQAATPAAPSMSRAAASTYYYCEKGQVGVVKWASCGHYSAGHYWARLELNNTSNRTVHFNYSWTVRDAASKGWYRCIWQASGGLNAYSGWATNCNYPYRIDNVAVDIWNID
jgi:hypothetical protein